MDGWDKNEGVSRPEKYFIGFMKQHYKWGTTVGSPRKRFKKGITLRNVTKSV